MTIRSIDRLIWAVERRPSFKDIQTKPFRILVAEDNASNQKIAIKVLERMGLHVHVVANGLEVLNALDSIPFDLVLMDCQMPELDGYEATRRIRSHPTLPRTNIPIVAMTANAITGDRERCLAAGMNDYISKPVKFDGLYSVLSRWLINKSKAS
ncbi:MAG: response regulator [Oligoflexus sp.]|nr:response regulator [Oligoflexus sp.]